MKNQIQARPNAWLRIFSRYLFTCIESDRLFNGLCLTVNLNLYTSTKMLYIFGILNFTPRQYNSPLIGPKIFITPQIMYFKNRVIFIFKCWQYNIFKNCYGHFHFSVISRHSRNLEGTSFETRYTECLTSAVQSKGIFPNITARIVICVSDNGSAPDCTWLRN